MSSRIALYWDFENLHASLVDERFGEGEYRRSQYQAQEPLIDVAAIMAFARERGPLSANRAYCNWQSFRRYRPALLSDAVELIQLFHLGPHGKNGADIRLALDALDDLWRFPEISTLLIIGGDSDYIPLAQKARQRGRTVIGVGVESTTNVYWRRTCDSFRFYRELIAERGPDPCYGDDELEPAADDYEGCLSTMGLHLPPPELRREALRRMLAVFQGAPEGLIYDFSDIDAQVGADHESAALIEAVRTLRRSFYALYMFEMHGRGNGIGLKFSDSLASIQQAYADRLSQRLHRSGLLSLDAGRVTALIDGPEDEDSSEVVALVEGLLEAYS